MSCSKVEAPPYGFGAAPEQRFRFEADETTEVDGTPVKIVRVADVVLRAKLEPSDSARATEVELYIDRYFIRIEGAPHGCNAAQGHFHQRPAGFIAISQAHRARELVATRVRRDVDLAL